MIEPVRDARPSLPAVRADDPRTAAEAVLFEIRRVIVGQDADARAGARRAAGRRPPPPRGRARPRQDAHDPDPRRRPRRVVPADPVHPGPRPRATSSAPASTAPTPAHFDTELGPVFCNFLLADEINRAPAKVQSALLEVMQERQVTIGPESHAVPRPFLVMATQNPIESEGTYPLPEAQVDRFMMKVVVGYPTPGRGGRGRRALAPARGRRGPRRSSTADGARRAPGRDAARSTSTRRSSHYAVAHRHRHPRARPRRPGRAQAATSPTAPAPAARST